MAVLAFRAQVKDDAVAEAEEGVKKMFAALEAAAPDNVRYASLKLADGVTFLALVQIAEGTENPLPKIPEWVELQAKLEEWRVDDPTIDQGTVVGSYRLFD